MGINAKENENMNFHSNIIIFLVIKEQAHSLGAWADPGISIRGGGGPGQSDIKALTTFFFFF